MPLTVTLTTTEDTVHVSAPYHPHFRSRAHDFGGHWSRELGQWRFAAAKESLVRTLCLAVYGEDGTTIPERFTLRIRATRDHRARLSAVFGLGRTLARAWGRDSGARPGEGVALVHGTIDSGGSIANWQTIIRAETVLDVFEVPEALAERPMESGWALLTRRDAKSEPADHATLRHEREALTRRIAEIDAALDRPETSDN